MKAITLIQPYATLIMLGFKKLETRSWSTRHRGPLAIHAGLGMPGWARKVCEENHHIRLILDEQGLTFDTLPRGGILGLCDVKGMLQIQEPGTGIKLGQVDPATLQPVEVACGDYTPNRWAWQLQRHRPLAEPVACSGALSAWEVPADIAQRVEEAEKAVYAHG